MVMNAHHVTINYLQTIHNSHSPDFTKGVPNLMTEDCSKQITNTPWQR